MRVRPPKPRSPRLKLDTSPKAVRMQFPSWCHRTTFNVLPWISLMLTVCALSSEAGQVKPSTVKELRAAIQKELDEVGHGAAGVALVSRDRTIWAAGIGIADTETLREADENTYWRLGSISKSFVGLAALILEERGRLRLTDVVTELVPEIKISNRWDAKTRVQLAHLLEHTAGLDGLHYKAYASNDPTPTSLLSGLDHIQGSLYCRWPPGLHFSYSNAGPAVAGYIVQKLDGRLFEDFLQDEILEPVKMTGAGLLLTDDLEGRLATGYGVDGKPVPYRHLVVRPSGAFSATPRQMANFVRMLLNRGQFDGHRLVSPGSIARMERSETTLSATLLPDYGYGLGNGSSSSHGFVFRGHGGGMPGYRARYAYLPDQGLGYCLMVSVSNDKLTNHVDRLVSEYLVQNLEKPRAPIVTDMAADIDQWTGYYRPVTFRYDSKRYAERLAGVGRLSRRGDVLFVEMLGQQLEFYPTGNRVFKRKSQPMATLAFVEGPDGTKYVAGEIGNLRKVSAAVIWFERFAAAITALLMVSSPLWAVVWVPLKLVGGLKGRPVAVRVWPLLAVMALVIAMAAIGTSTGGGSFTKLVDQLGRPTLAAVSFVVSSWVFVLSALQGLNCSLRRNPQHVGRFARLHSIAVSSACLMAAAYLLHFRAIGFPTWW